jgi:hypothetical protein
LQWLLNKAGAKIPRGKHLDDLVSRILAGTEDVSNWQFKALEELPGGIGSMGFLESFELVRLPPS